MREQKDRVTAEGSRQKKSRGRENMRAKAKGNWTQGREVVTGEQGPAPGTAPPLQKVFPMTPLIQPPAPRGRGGQPQMHMQKQGRGRGRCRNSRGHRNTDTCAVSVRRNTVVSKLRK